MIFVNDLFMAVCTQCSGHPVSRNKGSIYVEPSMDNGSDILHTELFRVHFKSMNRLL